MEPRVMLYQSEGPFHEWIFKFEERYNSLSRYFEKFDNNLNKYLNERDVEAEYREMDFSDVEEEFQSFIDVNAAIDFAKEEHEIDSEYHRQFFYLSIVTHLLTLVESTLLDIIDEVSQNYEDPQEYFKSNTKPYINRYLDYLRHVAKFKFSLKEDIHKELRLVRVMRNNFIHKLMVDIPPNLKADFEEFLDFKQDMKVDFNAVCKSFLLVEEMIKQIELAYLKWIVSN